MRFEDVLPALREKRRVRRVGWKPGDYMVKSGSTEATISYHSGPLSHSWPNRPVDTYDLMKEDWEILPVLPREGHIPFHYRDALDIVLATMSKEREETADRPDREKEMSGWEEMGKACLGEFVEAGLAKNKDGRKAALGRACVRSLRALANVMAEEYVVKVMED